MLAERQRTRVDPTSLLLLALAASVYPTLLAGVVLILARPRPLRLLIAFLIGGMAISVLAGITIVNALESSGFAGASHRTAQPVVAIAAGAICVAVAWGISTDRISGGLRRPRGRDRARGHMRPSLTTRVLSRGSISMALVAGVLLNLPGVWYLEALTEIAKAEPSDASAMVQILLFNVIMFALVEIPIVAYLVNPDRAATLVNAASGWSHRHSRAIAIALATGVGLWLIAKGMAGLLS